MLIAGTEQRHGRKQQVAVMMNGLGRQVRVAVGEWDPAVRDQAEPGVHGDRYGDDRIVAAIERLRRLQIVGQDCGQEFRRLAQLAQDRRARPMRGIFVGVVAECLDQAADGVGDNRHDPWSLAGLPNRSFIAAPYRCPS